MSQATKKTSLRNKPTEPTEPTPTTLRHSILQHLQTLKIRLTEADLDSIAFVGKSGLGKSHLIQGIGRACCVLGSRVHYVTSATLLEELTAAIAVKAITSKVRYYASFDLLIIDEFGFDKLERREYPESASLLYKVVDARSGRGSPAFVTNVDFSDWSEYLDDPPLVMAMLDRVVDSAIVLRFEGKSYRQHRTERKQAAAKQSSTQS